MQSYSDDSHQQSLFDDLEKTWPAPGDRRHGQASAWIAVLSRSRDLKIVAALPDGSQCWQSEDFEHLEANTTDRACVPTVSDER